MYLRSRDSDLRTNIGRCMRLHTRVFHALYKDTGSKPRVIASTRLRAVLQACCTLPLAKVLLSESGTRSVHETSGLLDCQRL